MCSTGSMAKNVWKTGAEGNWYYLGPDGVMLTNTKTPDGYRVGADGVWIQ
jgi:serine-type D-Ala-D-Ala carboxypeptidase (penicillin-binding protein 5/6)